MFRLFPFKKITMQKLILLLHLCFAQRVQTFAEAKISAIREELKFTSQKFEDPENVTFELK